MTTVFGISLIGWIHTITGSLAIFIGIYILYKYKLIAYSLHSGKIYIFLTGISAATSLFIFNKGGFNLAHLLGLFTLFALFIGFIFERKQIFGISRYFQAFSYSATLLFSLIPGISEVFTRLPSGNPIAQSIFDPVLQKTFLLLTFLYICLIAYQSYWIKFRLKT
ncbi:MAG: hypothetical protein CMQ60_01425 [Gammaproteobacteria bacterium]|nr:hypothetical protein [Gammaproteobacteria bacterium]|tara:strand:- start:386 stop:880 length:495 start_codon:yes stop_codon:yes gene_type:complete